MNKFWHFVFALLPLGSLAAQQPAPQSPSLNRPHFQPPSPEVMRHMAEVRRRDRDHAIVINYLASDIKSPDESRKLVDLVVAEFSDEMPHRWASRSIRDRVARAEYNSATNPGSLISEQHIADVWNEYVQKIGAPRETMLNAAEIHYCRDAQYVSAQLSWTNYEKDIWTIPGVFALGPDGKVAKGSRALEAIRLLWLLGNNEDDFAGIHKQVQKGALLSDLYLHPETPIAPGQKGQGYASFSIVSFPVQGAALQYIRNHGVRAFDRAIEGLLKELLSN